VGLGAGGGAEADVDVEGAADPDGEVESAAAAVPDTLGGGSEPLGVAPIDNDPELLPATDGVLEAEGAAPLPVGVDEAEGAAARLPEDEVEGAPTLAVEELDTELGL